MNIDDIYSDISHPVTPQEAAQSYRATHGRGASRHIAVEFGVSQRTAQRWLAGTQRPRNAEPLMAAAARDNAPQVRANVFRNASGVNVGTVQVLEKSPGKRSARNVGTVFCDLSSVADALDAGASQQQAADMISDIVMAAYGTDALAAVDYGAFDIF